MADKKKLDKAKMQSKDIENAYPEFFSPKLSPSQHNPSEHLLDAYSNPRTSHEQELIAEIENLRVTLGMNKRENDDIRMKLAAGDSNWPTGGPAMDRLGGPVAGASQMGYQGVGGKTENVDMDSMVKWLHDNKFAFESINKLLMAGCHSMHSLEILQDQDLDAIGLSIVQKRLLQEALSAYGGAHPGAAQHKPVNPAGPYNSGEGQLHSEFFLGMGVHGDQKPYLDICDFVSIRSPYESQSSSDTVISHKADGSFEVKPSTTKRVPLEKITMAQWVEGNAQIMARLLEKGVNPRTYLSYTVMVAQLAQKYDWQSVLIWDREYRKSQANLLFDWGSDVSHLRDIMLIPKQRKFGSFSKEQVKSDQGKKDYSKTGQKGGGSAPNRKKGWGDRTGSTGNRDLVTEGKLKLCRAFNAGSCPYEKCVFRHFCAQCGAADHGEKNHPKA